MKTTASQLANSIARIQANLISRHNRAIRVTQHLVERQRDTQHEDANAYKARQGYSIACVL